MIKKSILFVFLIAASINAQVFLESYEESNSEITLKLKLSTVEFLSRNSESGFYDESKPGHFALPTKSIIVGIPYSENYNFSSKIISESNEKFSLGFNPEVNENKKGNLDYNFLPKKLIRDKQKPILKVNGYFWQNEIYCVNLEINQYNYDEIKSVLNAIDEIEVKIEFSKSSNLFKTTKSSVNESVLKTLINGSYALKYWGKPLDILVSDTTGDWIDYSANYLKIGVAEDGIYRVNYDDLVAMGIPINMLVPQTLKMFLKGEELPIFVSGENDNVFDATDFIEFVGIRNMGGNHRELSSYDEPYNEYLGRYTDTTIYWLTWDGIDGKRVQISDGNLNTTDTLDYYHEIIHSEKNGWFDFSEASLVRREMPYWIENKTWNEGNLVVGTKEKSFVVSDIYPNKNFTLYSKLQDQASNISLKAHLVAMSLNSNTDYYDSTYIDKYQKAILKVELNSNLLNDGANIFKIHSFPTDNTVNRCVFDWFEVEYPRYLKPIDNSLVFSFPYLTTISIKLFKLLDISTNDITLWKYGESIKKYNISASNNQITISDSISSTDKVLYTDISQIKSPKYYYTKQFINLRNNENRADYLAITHKNFRPKVNEYSSFISNSYELDTKVIDIDDIYDEFAYGYFNPEAIKDFIKSTHDYWQDAKPQNVVLIGGATYDYYGNKYKYTGVDHRVSNYVPSFGASVSDNWFVTWDTTGAYIPQLNIGRIPVTTNEELEWYFEKHVDYLTQDYDDWNKRYLFFSGGKPTNQSELDLLKETNQFVIDTYTLPAPIGGKVDHFYKTSDPKTNFGPNSQEYIQNSIDNGGVFISYIGHSGTQTWDNSITDPSQLKNNKGRYPIVSDFGCSTGRFAEPDVVSFSQLFTLDGEGQSLAYVGNSSLGFISTSISMPKLFYKKILAEDIYNVSEAHKQAKIEMLQSYGSTGVYALFSLTNTLIGDPLITLPIPQKSNFVIKDEDININLDLITDLQDSIDLFYTVFNYGKVLQDTLDIIIIHDFENENDSVVQRIKIPNYQDSLNIKLAVKNRAGHHNVAIFLDPDNKIDEISEEDNQASFVFNVASSSLRPIIQYQIENGISSKIIFLNPTSTPSSESIIVEYSMDEIFSEVNSSEVILDSLSTKIDFTQLQNDQRYWCRAKLLESENYSVIFSFDNSKNYKYLMSDSLSISLNHSQYLKEANSIFLDSLSDKFELHSAGFNDGNTAVIDRNGVNYIPESTIPGHHVTLFDANPPFEFIEYHYFNTLAGGDYITNYIQLLDTLSSDYLVAIAISDEGTPRSDELKTQIKSLGSQLIDNVGWRASWAFIGYKGATPGTMPEAYSKSGDGPVTIDTTITFLSESGSMLTKEIGPTSNWDKMVVNQETPSNSAITYTPIGIRGDGVLDTLQSLTLQDSVAELNYIDAAIYPKLKILADFTASDDKQSPVLSSLGVDYTDVAELGLNYQVVSVEHDSVTQGEKNKLSFYIYNVGESRADSFNVKVELLKPDNSTQLIDQFSTSIDSSNRKYFEYDYTLLKEYGWGNMLFAVTVDSENKITEFFEDNNYYQIPFYVKKDTLTDVATAEASITIDGYDILDGDFVSNEPEILFQIDYQGTFPVSDTTAVNYYLDNKRIPYTSMQMEYDTINQTIKSEYKPTLENGDHFLKVSGDSFSFDKYFEVSNELKIVDLYNYPNPFAENTSFTFKLTRVPEEVLIKIYTVAGRLIKNISLNSNALKTDFNKIEWDGRDEDGDRIANGVYIYKVILKDPNESESYTQKLAIVR